MRILAFEFFEVGAHPAQAPLLGEDKIGAAGGRAGRHVAVPAPALGAVADQHVAQWALHLV